MDNGTQKPVQLQGHLRESDGDFMASLMTSKAFNLIMSFSSSSIDPGLQISWSILMERYAAV